MNDSIGLILTNEMLVKHEEDQSRLLILNPATMDELGPMIRISRETLQAMSMDDATAFVGFRILMLIPEMRKLFAKELDALIRHGSLPPGEST